MKMRTPLPPPEQKHHKSLNLNLKPSLRVRILDEFRGRGWMPLEPKLLDYENTQFLLIGHNDGALDKATVPQPEDAKQDKDEPKAEMEKLEHEDDVRVEHLKGDDSVFEDLGLSSKEYPKLQTTW